MLAKTIYMLFFLQLTGPAFAQERADNRRELNGCKLSQKRYLSLKDSKVECRKNYILFETKNVKKISTSNIKVAAFNILRTGTEQTRFKRFDYLAQMMNRWDLVAAVELMPTPQKKVDYNKKIDKTRHQYETNKSNYSKTQQKNYEKLLDISYDKPGYLRILEALRKKDPSWSLIMAPESTGDHHTSHELSAFYYRASKVTNKPSSFCGQERGCLLPFNKNLNRLISRIPFVARFVAGKLDFSGVAVHMRFREPGELSFTKTEKQYINEFKDVGNVQHKFRFIELAIINDSMKRANTDFMLLGDFNLDYDPHNQRSDRNLEFWEKALNGKDQAILVEENTSVSEKNGTVNSYDHFVIETHPGSTLKGCKTATAKAYNFLVDHKDKAPKELSGLSAFMKKRQQNKKAVLNQYIQKITDQKRIGQCTKNSCSTQNRYDKNDIDELKKAYEDRVLKSSEKKSGKLKKFPYRVHIELLSDHLPIEISCSTN